MIAAAEAAFTSIHGFLDRLKARADLGHAGVTGIASGSKQLFNTLPSDRGYAGEWR